MGAGKGLSFLGERNTSVLGENTHNWREREGREQRAGVQTTLTMETLGAVTRHLQGWEQPMLPAQLIYQEAQCTFTTEPRRSRAQETRDRRADAPAPSAHQGELGSFLNEEEEVGGLEPIRLTPATREGCHSLAWIPPSRAGSLPPGPPASGPGSQHGEQSVSCLTKELLGDLRGSLTASLLPPLLSAFGTPSTCWASTRATPGCADGLPPVSRPRTPHLPPVPAEAGGAGRWPRLSEGRVGWGAR